MMFAILAVMMIFMTVVMRVWSMVYFNVMPDMRFVVIVDDHRTHPGAPNRIQRDTQHHQYT